MLQGFFMALLFFVAGYFVPKSYDAKGAPSFLAGRLFRLGLPTLLFVGALGPADRSISSHPWAFQSLPARGGGSTSARRLPRRHGTVMVLRGAPDLFDRLRRLARDGFPRSPSEAPNRYRPCQRCAGDVAIAATTFLVRLASPLGSSVLQHAARYFPSYILMFAAGVGAPAADDWIRTVTDRFACTTAAICVGSAMLVAAVASAWRRIDGPDCASPAAPPGRAPA